MERLLIKILRFALWDDTFSDKLSFGEFCEVLSLADDQTVFGLVFDVLKGLDTERFENKMPIYEAIGMMEQIKQQNRSVNKELADFSAICEKNELDYIVVKGQTMGCLYTEPLLRAPGDIDFLVNVTQKSQKSQKELYSQIAHLLGVEIPKMVEYEVGFDRNEIRYELHTNLRGWAKKEHQEVWDALIEKEWKQVHYVDIEGQKVRTLSPTLNAAYVFIHLFFHFIREGVSLRQMCDWAMMLHHYNKNIDRKALLQILRDLDIYGAYCVFGTILVDKLGLPLREFPVPINDKDRKWQEKVLDDIFRGGNFGMLNHEANSSWKYKAETFRVALRNSFKYYRLCPSEVGGMLPRLVKGNLKILLKR